MCSQQFFVSLVYRIENNFVQRVINKELHVIIVQFGINSPQNMQLPVLIGHSENKSLTLFSSPKRGSTCSDVSTSRHGQLQ